MGDALISVARKIAEKIQDQIGNNIFQELINNSFFQEEEYDSEAKSNYNTEIQKTAQEIKVLTDALQALKNAAKQIGVEFRSSYKEKAQEIAEEPIQHNVQNMNQISKDVNASGIDISNNVLQAKSYGATTKPLISEIETIEKPLS